MAHVRLDNVMMPEARKLTLKAKAQVLAESLTGDPLLCAFDRPEGQGARPDRRPRQERPAAPDRLPDPGEQRPGVVHGKPGRAARVARHGHGHRDRAAGAEPGRARASGCSDRPTAGAAPCPAARPGRRSVRSTAAASGRRHRPRTAPSDVRSLELACNLASSPGERPPARRGARDERGAGRAGFGGRPVWFYLIAAAWGLAGAGVVPLSTPVDQLICAMPRILLRADTARSGCWAWSACRSSYYYFRRSLVDFARWQKAASLALRAAIVVPAGAGAGRPDAPEPDPRAVRRLRDRPEPERRRRLAEGGRGVRREGRGARRAGTGSRPCAFAAEPGVVQGGNERARNRPASRRRSTTAGPTSPRPSRSRRRRSRRSTSPRSSSSPTATRPPATPSRPRSARGCRSRPSRSQTRHDPEVQVSAVNVPAQVQQGEPFNVEVVIDSNHDDEGRRSRSTAARIKVAVRAEEAQEGGEPVPLPPDDRAGAARHVHRPGCGGSSDTLLDNNSDFGLVFTSGKPRVLLIESDPKQAKRPDLRPRGAGHAGRRPPARRGCPTSLADLQNYELLILSNVPATALTHPADGGGPDLRAGPRRRPDHARRRPVVRPGRLLQDGARGDPAGPERLREGEGEAEPGDDAGDRQVGLDGRREDRDGQGGRQGARSSCSGPATRSACIAFEGETFWVSEMHPCTDKGVRARPDRHDRGRRRHRDVPGDGRGLRGAPARPSPSSST